MVPAEAIIMNMKTRIPFLQLFTIALTVWTGLIYVLLLSLRISHRMLHREELLLIVFGPAALLLAALAAYELRLARRR
jgi:hypothetical protein